MPRVNLTEEELSVIFQRREIESHEKRGWNQGVAACIEAIDKAVAENEFTPQSLSDALIALKKD